MTRDDFQQMWGDDELEPDLRWVGVLVTVVFSLVAWAAIGVVVWWLIR